MVLSPGLSGLAQASQPGRILISEL